MGGPGIAEGHSRVEDILIHAPFSFDKDSLGAGVAVATGQPVIM